MSRIVIDDVRWAKMYAFCQSCPHVHVYSEASLRRFFEAELWGVRSGVQWRLLPAEYGRWNSVCKRFARWCDLGVWAAMHLHFTDNLALEALFSALRRHQRRISGHKTTRELSVLGHFQVLFQAESEKELLAQLRIVPLDRYRHHRQRLQQAAEPRRFIHRLHRNPDSTIQSLADAYKKRRRQLLQSKNPDRQENTS